MHRACRMRLLLNYADETNQFVPRRTVMQAASCMHARPILHRSGGLNWRSFHRELISTRIGARRKRCVLRLQCLRRAQLGISSSEFIVEFPECDQGCSELAQRSLLNPE